MAASQRAPRLDQPAESAEQSAVPAIPETPIESPHPEESSYLDLGAESTQTEESTTAAIESPRPEDEGTRPEDLTGSPVEAAPLRTQPTLKPPSTGEVVAANPPGRPAQQAELFESNEEPAAESAAPPTGDAATAPESTTPDAANGTHRSEPAAHHG